MLDNVRKTLRALKSLDLPVDQWDVLIIYIIKEKLNYHTIERWEDMIGGTDLPSLDQILLFLERRALLESTQTFQKQINSNFNKNQLSKGNFHSRNSSRPSQTCMATSVDSKNENSKSTCHACSGSYQVH